MENQIKSGKIISLESVKASMLPELQGWKEKQEAVVKENPFVVITDNKTYEDAKKSRTALVTARTTVEKQDKLIASKLKVVRDEVSSETQKLVNITLPHEEKQQNEVRRYEAIKEAERVAKEEAENKRKDAIQTKIEAIYQTIKTKIEHLLFSGIASFKAELDETISNTDVAEFEEFEMQFASKVQLLRQQLEDKIKILTENENQRVEAAKLAKDKAEFEAQKKAKLEADKKEAKKREEKQKAIDAANKQKSDKLKADAAAIEKEKKEVAESALKLKTDTRIKELTDRDLKFDFQSTFAGFNFFIDLLDIKTYDDEKWSDLIKKIDEVKSRPIVEVENNEIPVDVKEIEVLEKEVENTPSEEVQKVFKNLAAKGLFICDYMNGRACLKNSKDEIVFSFKLHEGIETLVSLKMALNEFSTLKNQIFN